MASGSNGRGYRNDHSCCSSVTTEFNAKEKSRQRKRTISEVECDSQMERICSPTTLPYNSASKQLKLDGHRNVGNHGEHSISYLDQLKSNASSSKLQDSLHSFNLKGNNSRQTMATSHDGKKYQPRKSKRRHDRYYEETASDLIPPKKRRKLERDDKDKNLSEPSSSTLDKGQLNLRNQPKIARSRYLHHVPGDQSRKRKRNSQNLSPKSRPYRDESWMNSIITFTFDCIMSLNKLPLEELVKKLSSRIKTFQYTLDKVRLLEKAGVMEALIKVLSKIADPLTLSIESNRKACLQILGEALSDRCARFQLHLKMYIKNELSSEKKFLKQKHDTTMLSREEIIKCLCKLFHDMLRALPTSSKSWLPVEDLQRAVEQLPNSIPYKESLLEDIKALSLHLDEIREKHLKQNKKKDCQSAWNNNEFKEIQIIPLWNEVCTSQKPPLRENIISGGYMDWLHYYDIQFRLLREDFVAPLRKGVCEYLNGAQGRKLSNVRVYKKVLLKEPIFKSPHGVCYKIKLTDLNSRIDWEHSKRLLHGSLLCLTPEKDNFKETIYFANVIHRDPKEITKGELIIMFKEDEKMLLFSCKDTVFTMVESCAYFEASQHILRSLQTAEADTMPFTEYLIEGDFSSVKQPQYLTVDPELAYNLTSLITEEEKDQDDSSASLSDGEIIDDDVKPKKVILRNECFLTKQVTNISSWPTCEQADLDPSQLKGIHMALTQEIAVIQGPPGTGKTYVGLKIVEALLSNKNICNPYGARSPILIMCLTNHALDQFLEGILKSQLYKNTLPNLIRIGGRSQSKELAKFNLVEVRKNVSLPYEVRREKRFTERYVKKFSMSKIRQFLSVSNTHLTFPLEMLAKYNVMHPRHYSELFDLAHTTRQSSCVLEMWLGLDTSNSRLKRMIGSAISKYEKSQKKSRQPPNQIGRSNDKMAPTQASKQNSKENKSDTESLIEVEGDAIVEQSSRILDDEHECDKFQDFACHLELDFSEYKERCVNFDEERAAKILSYGFSLLPMSEEESTKVCNIHNLAFEDRWRLYQYWHSECLKHLSEECEQDFLVYNRLCSEQVNVRRTADCFALETAEIIGMTTTGAAKYQHILHRVKPRIVIVEEAAEVLESHIVSALNAGTQHLILIGDHKQLRPKPNEYELAVKYKLDISLFERLIRNDFPHATLECQHRMRPEIAELVKPHIYPALSNHHSVEDHPDVRGVRTNLFFINHEVQEQEDESLFSHSNFHEASYLVSLCRYLLQQRYGHEEITILVTYTGQLRIVRKLMPKSEFEGVRVCTVDNFQGEENAIILLSLVRSNSEKNVGFLKEENRVCVALSRARQGFYCIGNFNMLCEKVPLWDKIMADMEQKERLGDGLVLHCSNHPNKHFTAKTPEDFEKYSPKGGCLEDCNFRLECGHVCAQKCHYSDPEHSKYTCKKRCNKSCTEGHVCLKPCFAPCDKCETLVSKKMPHCEHEQMMFCHKDPSQVNCVKPCKKNCPQGHACPLQCHQKCQPCEVKVCIIMPSCQHKQWIKCHQEPSSIKCKAKCPHSCVEGHPCPKLCYEECGNCMVLVSKTILKCSHVVMLPCNVEPNHNECTMPCEKTLPCEHKCQLKCGGDCSTSLCMENVTVKLPSCGHQVQVHCHQIANPEEYPCKEKCLKRFDCDHPCSKECGETCDEKCQYKCSQLLSCGHKCMGKCSQCAAERMHNLCPFKRQITRFCGHSFQTSCSGLMDDHSGNRKLTISCFHESRHVNCSDEVFHICDEQCWWNCEHFECSKLCHEMCERPRCDQRCQKKLKCGHQCYGLCGEPCLTLCPQCHLRRFQTKLKSANHFNRKKLYYELPCNHSKLKSANHFNRKKLYYELPCNHIFPVQCLDEYVQQLTNPQSHTLVCPIQCPVKECSRPLSCSGRYGNLVKQNFFHVQNINIITSNNSTNNSKLLLADRLKKISSDELPSDIIRALEICKLRIHPVQVYNDEKYLIFIFTEAVRMFKILAKKSSQSTVNSNYVRPLKEVETFLSVVCRLIFEHKAKLTYQVVNDIQNKFFRLYLHLHVLLAKSGDTTAMKSEFSATSCPHSKIEAKSTIDDSNVPECTSSFIVDDSQSDSDTLDSDLYALRTFFSSDESTSNPDCHATALPVLTETDSKLIDCAHSISTEFSSSSKDPFVDYSPGIEEPLISVLSPTVTQATINAVIDAAEEYLENETLHNLQVTKFHCEAIKEFVLTTNLDYDRILEEMDWFYPVIQKGQWWRCPYNGNYYCLLPSHDNDETKCPECDGEKIS